MPSVNPGPSTSNLSTNPNRDGDQQVISNDSSKFRTGSWSQATGAIYSLAGEFVMWYWTHNCALDPNTGNFLGRDEAEPCMLYIITESNRFLRFDAPTAGAGTLPVFGAGYSDTRLSADIGIPMILVSSGSIGNNGALTGVSTLPVTYADCYMYFPANAIYTGSAAGLYYTKMSSATAGTIYKNVYTSGIPTIPANPTAFVTTGPGAYTQTTGSNINLLTVSVPGGYLGNNGTLQIGTMWSNIGNTDNKIMAISFGGTDVQKVTQATAANISAEWTTEVMNRGKPTVQVFGPITQVGHGASTAAMVQGSIDTTTAQNVIAYAQLATATDWVVLEGIDINIKAS